MIHIINIFLSTFCVFLIALTMPSFVTLYELPHPPAYAFANKTCCTFMRAIYTFDCPAVCGAGNNASNSWTRTVGRSAMYVCRTQAHVLRDFNVCVCVHVRSSFRRLLSRRSRRSLRHAPQPATHTNLHTGSFFMHTDTERHHLVHPFLAYAIQVEHAYVSVSSEDVA